MKKNLLILFCLLTTVNLVIFYYRDSFAYTPYRSYEALYNRDWGGNLWTEEYREINEAKRISDAWLPNQPIPTVEKASLIAGWLHKKFGHRMGKLSPSLVTLSPIHLYRTIDNATNQRDSIWCGVYAGLFSLFSWSQHIVTRTIEPRYTGGGGAHVLNECYIPELKKWVMVDPTFGLLAVKNSAGVWLDFQTFKQALLQHRTLYVLRCDSTLQWTLLNPNEDYITKFYKKNSTDYYYHHTSLQQAYKPLEKIKRYFLPVSWYDIYAPPNRTNLLFSLKILFILSWLIVTGLLVKRGT